MKNLLLSIVLIFSFLNSNNAQCSIDPIPDSAFLPIAVEGSAFQFSTAFGNPLPVNVLWEVDGGAIILGESETTEQVLIDFPIEGTYTICGEAFDDSGNSLCSVCYNFDYLAVVTNPCGNVVATATEDTSTGLAGWYTLESVNLDSVDLNTISWDAGGGIIASISPNVPAVTIEYPNEGLYTACMNYTSLSGETCSACTDVEYLTEVSLPCIIDLQYNPSNEGTYEYFVYAEFSEEIDESTIFWDLGVGVELPSPVFQEIPEAIIVDFGGPGIYPVCVTVNALNGDVCSQCIDVFIQESTQDSCVTDLSFAQIPQEGLYYALAINYGNAPVDPATVQWDLGGGSLADSNATLNDANIDVVFPIDGAYNVCVTAINVDGEDCSVCVEILASPYELEPCMVNIMADPMNPETYEYLIYADIMGNVDMSTISWDFGGGIVQDTTIDPGDNFNMVIFPETGIYTVCASVMGLDGNSCEECMDVIVDEYIQDPCFLDINVNNSSDSTNYIYDFSVTPVFGNIDPNEGFTWTHSGGTLLYDGIDMIQLQFPDLGVYNVCVTALGLDSIECTNCVDVLVEPYVVPSCETGFWYYQDTYNGTYYFDSYTYGGEAPYTYEWIIQELGEIVSDQASFSLDSINGIADFTLCLNVTDDNGDICNYCDWIDAGTLPPVLPSDGCLDWNVIDLETPCYTDYTPVCGCDGMTYENACIAEQCFGVIEYTAGACPGYPVPGDPIDPDACTAEFFYFGQPNETGGIDLFFFGFGNNADDYIWDLGNGETTTGPDAFLTIDDLTVSSSLTVCMTTVSFWDSCSTSVCETIVLAGNPDGWIEGFVFDNSEQFVGTGAGQVERVTSSNGNPMSDVLVELVDWYGNVIESTTTDTDGEFTFNQLYFGDYHIHVNIEGATHVPYLVSLDPTEQFVGELNFELSQEGNVVSDIEEVDFASAISLSPNPTNGNVVLSLEMNENTLLDISILDLTGRTLFQGNEELSQGTFSKTLELEEYAAGIYFIRIQSGESLVTRKLIKQ